VILNIPHTNADLVFKESMTIFKGKVLDFLGLTNLAPITEQMDFKPIIIQCSQIDADAMLAKLKADIAAGTSINELEAIYLPLFHSKNLTPTGLFAESVDIIKSM